MQKEQVHEVLKAILIAFTLTILNADYGTNRQRRSHTLMDAHAQCMRRLDIDATSSFLYFLITIVGG